MTGEYQADLKNIVQKLKVIHDELLHLVGHRRPLSSTGGTLGRKGLGLVRSGRHDL
ncbi:MAG TPA: hypothetical protein VN857_12240 [Chthoniobacterales bacterium]|jgi:hypothetical protein|nr:hypothetical protein [Chthoniobacterales bacterium]